MYRLARIYGFQAAPDEAAVFLDRLYPRGIRKETMSQFVWLKDLTPSAALREWYHQDPDSRFAEFARRYRAELARPSGRQRWKSCVASMPDIPPLCC